MDFRSTPISYLGKKAKYVRLFGELGLEGRVPKFGDLTAGSGTIPLYMVECRGAQDLIVNDVSLFARLIADVFFVQAQTHDRHIKLGVRPLPAQGYMTEARESNGAWSRASVQAAAWIDGYCIANRDQPLMLLALACVLTAGAPRFSAIVGKMIGELTPASLAREVEKKARALRERQHGLHLHTLVTSENYLAPPLDDWDLEGRVMYLDPAWPTQPGHATVGNARAYGLYASTVMSVLLQEQLPIPPEYDVAEEDFYRQMRETVDGCLAHGARMFVAYQTTDERLDAVTGSIFEGLRVNTVSADKNESSTLREYLFEVMK